MLLLAGLLAACGTDAVTLPAETSQPAEPGFGLGAPNPNPDGLLLGRTMDDAGEPHSLVLHAASSAAQAVQANDSFVVLSGSGHFSVTGDAAVDSWLFVVDAEATGTAAPIVVIKGARGSVQDLAANPARWAGAAELTEDAPETSQRLSGLIETALTRALEPNGHVYGDIAQKLTSPVWQGVLVFNASVPAMPDQVQGTSTGELAGTAIDAYVIGFEGQSFVDPDPRTSSFFGVVDDVAATPVRAGFVNSAMASFQIG